ncbi:hypothetical protein [Nonomuraea rubra]|uniref:Uncharacterized protein n=1 Tax=Nonomuraea rubra TaxID=46180 RepID=A0A7X0NMK8_9ACTN|nr:hypothetical protein [Nonomuraea rubra]MBB6546234.1 hypothetical protein [Nonomuraea rubra]
MGTDWVPAAVRDLTDPAELDGLIRVHAHLSHALGRTLRTDPPEEIGHDTALRRWRDADARLRALLLLDTDADGAHPSHRVAVIGANRPPTPGHARRRPAVPGQRADEEAVARHLALLEHSAREFSRTVPGPYRRALRLSPATGMEADPWLEGFFDWLVPVVRAVRALYLWA